MQVQKPILSLYLTPANFKSDATKPVTITFDVNPESSWANPTNNSVYVYSDVDGAGFNTILTNDTIPKNAWTAGLTATAVNVGDVTTFRINAKGRNQATATLLIDNIVFTGCAVPEHPTITKAFSPNPIEVGGTSTLTFSLINPNTAVALTGVTFTDSLPTGMSVAAITSFGANSTNCTAGTWTHAVSDTTLSFTGGEIAASTTCELTVDVTTSVAGPSTNVSDFISSTETGTNDTSTGSATDTLTAVLPPEIDKVFSPNPIVEGGTSTLTFTITNPNQDDEITAVAFDDSLPAGVEVAGTPNAVTANCENSTVVTWSPAATDTTLNFSTGSIAGGGTCTVEVDVTAPTAGDYVNTSGAVTHDINGSTVGADTASDTLTVETATPALAILKQVSTSATGPWTSYLAVAAGTDIYYQITIENAGDAEVSSITVTDGTIDITSCDGTWTDPLPVANASDDLHIDTCVVGPVTAVDPGVTNTATASSPSTTDVTSSAVYATTGITLVKSANPTTFSAAGDLIDYTFTVENTGNATIGGPVTITDDILGTVTCPALSTIGDNDDYFDVGEVIVCTFNNYAITAGDAAAGFVTNIASATADGVTSPTDTVTVTTAAAIALDKTPATQTVASGSDATFTITLTNTGTTDLSNVTVSDATCTTGPTYNSGDDGDGILQTTETWTYDCTVSGVTAGFTNTADVTTDEGATASDTATVSVAAIALDKTPTTQTVVSGGDATFTITLTNTGEVDLNNVTVSDATCTTGPTYNSGDDGDGILQTTETWTYDCTVSGVTAGFTNTADVTTDEGATASDTATVSVAAIALDKTPTTQTVVSGGDATFTITLTNTGEVDLNNVTVSDATCTTGPTYNSGDDGDGILQTTETWTYDCTVSGVTAGFTNTADVTTDEGATASDTATVSVAAIALDKTPTTQTVVSGGDATFTITLTNTGEVDLNNVTVSDATCTTGPTYNSGDDGDGILQTTETGLTTVPSPGSLLVSLIRLMSPPMKAQPLLIRQPYR